MAEGNEEFLDPRNDEPKIEAKLNFQKQVSSSQLGRYSMGKY